MSSRGRVSVGLESLRSGANRGGIRRQALVPCMIPWMSSEIQECRRGDGGKSGLDTFTHLPHRPLSSILPWTSSEENMTRTKKSAKESLEGHPRVRLLVSYDVARARSSARGKVHRKVFGGQSRKAVNGRVKTYRYDGLLAREDVEYIGQSVLLLPTALGESLLKFLRSLEVPSQGTSVLIPP